MAKRTIGAGTTKKMTEDLNWNFTELYRLVDKTSGIYKELMNAVYPVGCYYWSSSSTSPATLFGGTWERIKDKFVLAAGDNYQAEATGGEAAVTLNINQIPEHTHQYFKVGLNTNPNTRLNPDDLPSGYYAVNAGDNNQTQSAGGSQSHNNMPPYIVAYCWKRTGAYNPPSTIENN